MRVIKLAGGQVWCNSYAVTADGENCLLIDCGDPDIQNRLSDYGLTVRAVLLTHGHLDHVYGCEKLSQAGAKIYCGEGEDKFIFSEGNREIFGVDLPRFSVDGTFKDGEEADICGLKVKVIATPGHSAGSVSYLIGDNLFTGDTLFRGSVGRCDFATGDERAIIRSVKKLCALDGNLTVCAGHGDDSTLNYERAHNPFLKL